MGTCLAHELSAATCQAAGVALHSQPLSSQLIDPVCTVLLQDDQSKGIKQRSLLHINAVHQNQVGMDSTMQRKSLLTDFKGQPDYIFHNKENAENPPLHRPGPSGEAPKHSVDYTIAMPPDSNGNPYDTPEAWASNTPSP